MRTVKVTVRVGIVFNTDGIKLCARHFDIFCKLNGIRNNRLNGISGGAVIGRVTVGNQNNNLFTIRTVIIGGKDIFGHFQTQVRLSCAVRLNTVNRFGQRLVYAENVTDRDKGITPSVPLAVGNVPVADFR